MKVRAGLLVIAAIGGGGFMGVALAEQATLAEGSPSEAGPAELVSGAEQVLVNMRQMRQRLATALQTAREQQDQLLTFCLEPKVRELDELQAKAATRMATLRATADVEQARVPYVAVTVIGQQAALIAEEAASCVGADDEEVDSLLDLEVRTERVAVEPPPEIVMGEPGGIWQPAPPPAIPGTGLDPSMEPGVPTPATPIR